MNTKSKGNIGEAKAIVEFSKYNIPLAIPFGDNERYDLIAEFNGKLNKIQVKYCNHESNTGSVLCPCASSYNHTTNKKYHKYTDQIDYFVFDLEPFDKIVLVPIESIGNQQSFHFRNSPTENGQKKGLNFVDDYTFDKYFGETNYDTENFYETDDIYGDIDDYDFNESKPWYYIEHGELKSRSPYSKHNE